MILSATVVVSSAIPSGILNPLFLTTAVGGLLLAGIMIALILDDSPLPGEESPAAEDPRTDDR